MSDPETPDFYRRGPDLIARIDELARARGIDPTVTDNSSEIGAEGNGWIYLLLACRRQVNMLPHWKDMNRELIANCKALTEALRRYQHLERIIETLCGDATVDPT